MSNQSSKLTFSKKRATSPRTHVIFVASLMVQLRGLAALDLLNLAHASEIDVETILELFRTKDDLVAALVQRGTLRTDECEDRSESLDCGRREPVATARHKRGNSAVSAPSADPQRFKETVGV